MAQQKTVNKLEIVGDDGNVFILKATEVQSGKVRDAQTYHAEKPMDTKGIGSVLSQDYKVLGTRRSAWQSLLGLVMATPTLDGYKGKGDVKAGSTSKEFKAAVRTAEDAVLKKMVDKEEIKLPPVAKDDPIHGNPDAIFQRFATSVREDKNYSNVKATVMKYFAFVGAAPTTKSGYLVPVPVMQAEVQRVLDANREQPDRSFAAQIRGILEQMEKETISLEDAAKAVTEAKRLHSTLDGIIAHYKELADHAAEGAGIPAAAAQAIAGAAGNAKEKSHAKRVTEAAGT